MEIWDLYDAQRRLTGETMVRSDNVPQGRYHLVVEVVVFSTDGRVLIQQRQASKESWPNYWSIASGGSALAGESSQDAAMREVQEEIGLTLDLHDVRPRLTLHREKNFSDWYVVTRDVDPSTLTLQESEVQAVRWATKKEVLRMIEEKTFIPHEPGFISLLFHLRDHLGTHTREE